MLNQVNIEGYLISSWKYGGRKYLRIASHNAPDGGGQTVSDYVTVRLADNIAFDPSETPSGTLLRISGKVWGRDILEPLGRVLQKSGIELNLSPEVAELVVTRPSTFVHALQITPIYDVKADAEQAVVKKARARRRTSRRNVSQEADTPAVPAAAAG